ncbi:NUDIX domain-containing protein [Mycoplana dimorpha]|uniref:ADP-ribose pyrophosphatase YjhB (NUDIX family) n=1 Tax=Mycoplana dimorpha TaxID=28320 RepID=A0A2T5AU11_MYCDI|nr:NUDIX domain-containing protein [Mycoplana dimorpha]PTM90218.1 ADP-ribose pyrophosphatase YjhB (NUDIX family) [Mycoplana dimorpha]
MSVPGVEIPGVGCGLAILRDDRLLLYRRARAPEAGHWSIVGGKVDHMEHSRDAARREAEEETGLAFGQIEFLCLSEMLFAADGQHWVSVIYTTEEFSGDPRVMEPEKLPEFGWFALDALPQPLSRFAADAVAALRSAAGRPLSA